MKVKFYSFLILGLCLFLGGLVAQWYLLSDFNIHVGNDEEYHTVYQPFERLVVGVTSVPMLVGVFILIYIFIRWLPHG